jgi:hypothetical protein
MIVQRMAEHVILVLTLSLLIYSQAANVMMMAAAEAAVIVLTVKSKIVLVMAIVAQNLGLAMVFVMMRQNNGDVI